MGTVLQGLMLALLSISALDVLTWVGLAGASVASLLVLLESKPAEQIALDEWTSWQKGLFWHPHGRGRCKTHT